MSQIRYVINSRGRRVGPMDDAQAQIALARGFTEVSQEEWQAKSYFPEFDKGDTFTPPLTTLPNTPIINQRTSLPTKAV